MPTDHTIHQVERILEGCDRIASDAACHVVRHRVDSVDLARVYTIDPGELDFSRLRPTLPRSRLPVRQADQFSVVPSYDLPASPVLSTEDREGSDHDLPDLKVPIGGRLGWDPQSVVAVVGGEVVSDGSAARSP